jgi:formiminotetrahydrofolate cyclodeaminase
MALRRGADPPSLGGSGAEAERDEKLRDALERAADLPLRIAEAAAAITELAALACERAQPSVRAHALVALLLAEASTRAAATFVEVNLATAERDPRIADARELVARARTNQERAQAASG